MKQLVTSPSYGVNGGCSNLAPGPVRMEGREIRYFGDDYSHHHQTCPVSPPHPTTPAPLRHYFLQQRLDVTIKSRNLPAPTRVGTKKSDASGGNAVLFMDEESGTAQAAWCAYRIRSRYLLFRTLRGGRSRSRKLRQLEQRLCWEAQSADRMTRPHQKECDSNSRGLSLDWSPDYVLSRS